MDCSDVPCYFLVTAVISGRLKLVPVFDPVETIEDLQEKTVTHSNNLLS